MTEMTPLALKLRTVYHDPVATSGYDTGHRWNAVAKVAEAELTAPRAVRLPTVEECHRAIGASCVNALVDPASVVLDLVASLNPTWVPVPADATIPAGTLVRTERDNYTSEQTILRDWRGDHRNRKSRFFVPSGTVLTTPDPRIESAARAIHDAGKSEYIWDDEPASVRDNYVRLAKAAIAALGEDI